MLQLYFTPWSSAIGFMGQGVDLEAERGKFKVESESSFKFEMLNVLAVT